MWGWVAKAAGFAWAHKHELSAAFQLWRKLRQKRKQEQDPGESAKDYYVRVGRPAIERAAHEAAKVVAAQEEGQ